MARAFLILLGLSLSAPHMARADENMVRLPQQVLGWKRDGQDKVFSRQTIFDYMDGGGMAHHPTAPQPRHRRLRLPPRNQRPHQDQADALVVGERNVHLSDVQQQGQEPDPRNRAGNLFRKKTSSLPHRRQTPPARPSRGQCVRPTLPGQPRGATWPRKPPGLPARRGSIGKPALSA